MTFESHLRVVSEQLTEMRARPMKFYRGRTGVARWWSTAVICWHLVVTWSCILAG